MSALWSASVISVPLVTVVSVWVFVHVEPRADIAALRVDARDAIVAPGHLVNARLAVTIGARLAGFAIEVIVTRHRQKCDIEHQKSPEKGQDE